MHAGVEEHVQLHVSDDERVNDGRVVVPMPAPIMPVSCAILTPPTRLDLTVVVTAIAKRQVAIVTLIPLQVKPVTTYFETYIRHIEPLSPQAGHAKLDLAAGITSIIRINVAIVTIVVSVVLAIATYFEAVVHAP